MRAYGAVGHSEGQWYEKRPTPTRANMASVLNGHARSRTIVRVSLDHTIIVLIHVPSCVYVRVKAPGCYVYLALSYVSLGGEGREGNCLPWRKLDPVPR